MPLGGPSLLFWLPSAFTLYWNNKCKCIHNPGWLQGVCFYYLGTNLSFCHLAFSEVTGTRDPWSCNLRSTLYCDSHHPDAKRHAATRLHGFESWFYCLLAVWLRMSYLSSQRLLLCHPVQWGNSQYLVHRVDISNKWVHVCIPHLVMQLESGELSSESC